MKKQTLFVVTIVLSLLTTTNSSASQCTSEDVIKELSNIAQPYYHLSTSDLQEEMEKLSNRGEVNIEMALELLKRWTNKDTDKENC